MGSVTQLLDRFKSGDEEALAVLCERYWNDLVRFARSRLPSQPLRAADEEDVAQSALIAFCRKIKCGDLSDVENREQLLAWLTTVTANKAIDRIRREQRAKAGGGKLASLSPIESLVADKAWMPLHQEVLADCYEHYVKRLPDNLRPFAELHLAGLTHAEIAAQLGCVRWTVLRKLQRIRDVWLQMARECGDI